MKYERMFDENGNRMFYTLEEMREWEDAQKNQPIDPGDAACNREYDMRAEIIQQKEDYIKNQELLYPVYQMIMLARKSIRSYKNRHSVKVTPAVYHSSITFPIKAVVL